MRALDAFGFADLTRAVLYDVAVTSFHRARLVLGRCWAIAPSGPRIVEDIPQPHRPFGASRRSRQCSTRPRHVQALAR